MSESELDPWVLYHESPCGQLSLLPDGTIVKINATLLAWLGLSEKEVVGEKRFQDFLAVGDRILYDTHFLPLLHMQRYANEFNFSIRKGDGAALPSLVSANEIQDDRGRPALIRMALFAIGERKRYEVELRAERRRAEQALRAKSDFVSLLTHEVRTPLNAIIGVSHLLAETDLTTEQKKYSDMLASSSTNLMQLLNSILDYSKVDSGKSRVEIQPFEFERIVRTTALGFQGSAIRKGIELVVDIDAGLPEYLGGDQVKLSQMINNLLGNAIKFTNAGSVRLLVEKLDETNSFVDVSFKIIDSGIGIPEDIIPKIFEEYSQADQDTGTTYGGTGLGLAIVHRLAHLHGSRVNVVSEVGKGSTFSFVLCFQIAAKPVEVHAAPVATGHSVDGLRVLIADDSADNQDILAIQLARWGVHVTQAVNGQDVLDKMGDGRFDLILMDLRMPILDGYAAAAAIRKLPREDCATVPIVAFSASATLGDRDIVSNLHFQDVLGKPYQPAELYETIARNAQRQ